MSRAAAAQMDISEETLLDYARFCVSCETDPVRWIEGAYPWGVKGTPLEKWKPHDWQLETADIIGRELTAMKAGEMKAMPIQISTASGHGIGKSAEVAMLNDWNLSTLADARGLTTANTLDQLTSKTWAEMAKWHNMSISKPFFVWTATRLFSADAEHIKSWAAEAAPWSEQNYEAFQGLHNQGLRILIQADEASNIPRIIFEVLEGAKTDKSTQIIHLNYGNPTRNSGYFYETFGLLKNYWHSRHIDARDVPGTNTELFSEWAEQYGEDSDFFRIRVKGEFPSASAMQFIPIPWVESSMRSAPNCLDDDALICGIDFARNGKCSNVMYYRRGRDGQTIKPDIYPDDPSSEHFVAKCAARLKDIRPDVIYGDGVGVGGPIIDRLCGLGFDVIDVQAGGRAVEDERHANKRAEMWSRGKQWIRDGGALWKDDGFKSELTTMETVPHPKGLTQLERKESLLKRGEPSPDVADAFMLTFAYETTEFAAAEYQEAQGGMLARMEYDQWADEPLSGDEPQMFQPDLHVRRKRQQLEGY